MPDNNVIIQSLKGRDELKPFMKKVMPFVQTVKVQYIITINLIAV